MGHQQLYWSHVRKSSQGSHFCRIYSNLHGLIWKYGLSLCRQHFCQYVKDVDFIKGKRRKEVNENLEWSFYFWCPSDVSFPVFL
uniref:Small ribosomal subunit protein uS14 n=1 Tax=Sciurus vulgaris TaxID=55149 RepID=A0A8D2B3X5_SCIVU